MDSVRFGRALGFGARSAARALAGAVDAATASSPAAKPAPSPPVRPAAAAASARPVASAVHTAARAAAHATVQARHTRKGLAQGGKRFGEAVWGPFVKLSGVLWLEITGSFFGIFALFAGHAAWAHRGDVHQVIHPAAASQDARLHLLLFAGMTLLFGYFCISSFVRAYRR